MHRRGILNVPDFIANAGGVICAAMEYRGASQAAAFDTIAETLRQNTGEVLASVRKNGVLQREAALQLAATRVQKAMAFRRWGIY